MILLEAFLISLTMIVVVWAMAFATLEMIKLWFTSITSFGFICATLMCFLVIILTPSVYESLVTYKAKQEVVVETGLEE